MTASTETHPIPIRSVLYERLSNLAAREGRRVEELAEELLTETLARRSGESLSPQGKMTFEEIFAPLQKGFEESGLTEEELGAIIDREVGANRNGRRYVIGC